VITGVTKGSNDSSVILITAEQKPVLYKLAIDGAVLSESVKRAMIGSKVTFDFLGSTQKEPYVVSATPLSSKEILVIFSEPMGTTALNPDFYTIEPELPVASVTQGDSNYSVILTTTSDQKEADYIVKVADLRGKKGNMIFFKNSSGWADPYIYTWDLKPAVSTSKPTWPGTAMTKLTDDWYFYQLPAEVKSADIKFSNNGSSQTSDLSREGSGCYISGAWQDTCDIPGYDPFGLGHSTLVDPSHNSASFAGVPVKDKTAPTITSAYFMNDNQIMIAFSEPVNTSADSVTSYKLDPELKITGARRTLYGTHVVVTTELYMEGADYTIAAQDITDKAGNTVSDDSVHVTPAPKTTTSDPSSLPRVVGAISTSNTEVVISFSKSMGNSAINPANYAIVQENINGEAGALGVKAAAFVDGSRVSIKLTTVSQNELTYRVMPSNIRDIDGNPIASAFFNSGVMIDAKSVAFPGTPPAGDAIVDTDGDKLFDNEEQSGWVINVFLLSGETVTKEVTSDISMKDTDNDGIADNEEKMYGTDPRDNDTDDDGLTDYQELNEIYSDPTKQDSDGDTLADGLEFNFFKTSPTTSDTDGDQIKDDDEIVVLNRNPRLADLPKPTIEIGSVDLRLDVRFTAESSEGTRHLETRSVESTLQQTDTKSFSNSSSNTQQISIEAEKTWGGDDAGASLKAGWAGEWTSSFSKESSYETQKAMSKSFGTEKEVTGEESVSRRYLVLLDHCIFH